jgi:hypothetical protein
MTYESCCEKFDVRAFVLSVLDESEIANVDELPPLKRPKALFRLAKNVSNTEGGFQTIIASITRTCSAIAITVIYDGC